MKNIPDNIEMHLNENPPTFVAIMNENISIKKIEIFPSKKAFGGSIDNKIFQIYRLKRFSSFDYNITYMNGVIEENNDKTKIDIKFSPIWIYKYTILAMIIFYIYVDILILLKNNLTLEMIALILSIEGLVLLTIWFISRNRIKLDKQKYLEIFKELFKEIEIKTSANNV